GNSMPLIARAGSVVGRGCAIRRCESADRSAAREWTASMRRESSSGPRDKRAKACAASMRRPCEASSTPLRGSALATSNHRCWQRERAKEHADAETDEALTMRARFGAAGDVIVVTGGANGIGRALARAAAQAGARVVVCDVDAAAMAALSSVAGISTRPLDVSDRAAVFHVLGGVERDFGKIDG